MEDQTGAIRAPRPAYERGNRQSKPKQDNKLAHRSRGRGEEAGDESRLPSKRIEMLGAVDQRAPG